MKDKLTHKTNLFLAQSGGYNHLGFKVISLDDVQPYFFPFWGTKLPFALQKKMKRKGQSQNIINQTRQTSYKTVFRRTGIINLSIIYCCCLSWSRFWRSKTALLSIDQFQLYKNRSTKTNDVFVHDLHFSCCYPYFFLLRFWPVAYFCSLSCLNKEKENIFFSHPLTIKTFF